MSTLDTSISPFVMDSSTGQLTVAHPSFLNYENISTYSIVVTAEDISGLKISMAVIVELMDENDPPILINSNVGSLKVSENSVPGTKIGLPMVVQDVDRNQTHAYELLSGNTYFEIDSSSGQLSIRLDEDEEEGK